MSSALSIKQHVVRNQENIFSQATSPCFCYGSDFPLIQLQNNLMAIVRKVGRVKPGWMWPFCLCYLYFLYSKAQSDTRYCTQSLSSNALCIRLMMLWVTQATNQPNQYAYNSSGGFLSKEWRTCRDNYTRKIEICGQMAVGPHLDKWTTWTSVVSPGMWPERICLRVLSSFLHGPLFIVIQQWLMSEIHMLLLCTEL